MLETAVNQPLLKRMIDPHYHNVLRKICACLQDCRCPWAITGSLGLSLQGMAMAVNDIDIQTDR